MEMMTRCRYLGFKLDWRNISTTTTTKTNRTQIITTMITGPDHWRAVMNRSPHPVHQNGDEDTMHIPGFKLDWRNISTTTKSKWWWGHSALAVCTYQAGEISQCPLSNLILHDNESNPFRWSSLGSEYCIRNTFTIPIIQDGHDHQSKVGDLS